MTNSEPSVLLGSGFYVVPTALRDWQGVQTLSLYTASKQEASACLTFVDLRQRNGSAFNFQHTLISHIGSHPSPFSGKLNRETSQEDFTPATLFRLLGNVNEAY